MPAGNVLAAERKLASKKKEVSKREGVAREARTNATARKGEEARAAKIAGDAETKSSAATKAESTQTNMVRRMKNEIEKGERMLQGMERAARVALEKFHREKEAFEAKALPLLLVKEQTVATARSSEAAAALDWLRSKRRERDNVAAVVRAAERDAKEKEELLMGAKKEMNAAALELGNLRSA
jgi:hypothetical protein